MCCKFIGDCSIAANKLAVSVGCVSDGHLTEILQYMFSFVMKDAAVHFFSGVDLQVKMMNAFKCFPLPTFVLPVILGDRTTAFACMAHYICSRRRFS